MIEVSLLEKETKWPQPDADFFKLGTNESRVLLKYNPILDEDFFKYAFDFKKAGNILTTYVLNHPRIDRLDTYFFPIAFLYRHSLELILKAIGFKKMSDLSEGRLFVRETFHNLSEILTTIKPFIGDSIEKDRDAFLWIQNLFEDMNNIDRESDSFRYPFGLSLKRDEDPFSEDAGIKLFTIRLFFEEQINIDLIAFVSKMEAAFSILTAYYRDIPINSEHYKKYHPIFLEVGGTSYSQCVLGYSYNKDKFGPYVKGYTESAEFLSECTKLKPQYKNFLIMPMGYLFRNGIELAMKEILFEESSFTFQEAAKKINKKKHKLLGIWNIIEGEILNHARPSEDDKTIEHVRHYISQIHDFDVEADKFRYPTNKDLIAHFSKPLNLDFENVAEFFCELASFLYGVVLMMSHQNELQAEMEYEYSKMQWENYNY